MAVLNRCLYNVADRKSLGVDVNVKGDEISKIKRGLHTIPMWMSLVVQNTIGIFTENDKWQQVLLSNFKTIHKPFLLTFSNFFITRGTSALLEGDRKTIS